ncbi:hypothetical protein [Chroococcidiopsis sp. CCMEE 29]|uniref:hypothetical protein n=1 Tax=Chroococcidiopsis sp. CCMEE 29 TaxID=155894 RepID=UPI0020200846|nr:hypothetical protein [Chroococcidiopsis sp. CCMEE 29]
MIFLKVRFSIKGGFVPGLERSPVANAGVGVGASRIPILLKVTRFSIPQPS